MSQLLSIHVSRMKKFFWGLNLAPFSVERFGRREKSELADSSAEQSKLRVGKKKIVGGLQKKNGSPRNVSMFDLLWFQVIAAVETNLQSPNLKMVFHNKFFFISP